MKRHGRWHVAAKPPQAPDPSPERGRKITLFRAIAPVYCWLMEQLPAVYQDYLADKDEDFVAAVLPVLRQSVAEGNHGVHIVLNPHVVQAHTDERIPFGEIRENID